MLRNALIICAALFLVAGLFRTHGVQAREDRVMPQRNETETDQKDKGPMLGGPKEVENDDPGGMPEAYGDESRESDGESEGEMEAETEREIRQEIEKLKEQVQRLEQEAEAREKLKVTEKEEREKEESILEAAGREYTLLKAGTLGLEYNFSYSYYSYDVIRQMEQQQGLRLEYHANHNLRHNLISDYALLDNVTLEAVLPFVYKYDKVGKTDEQGEEVSEEVTDLGDISLGVKYQPFKAGNTWPAPILNARVTFPTGRGEYDIDPENELATGSGLYSLSGGVSVSQPFDPVNAFSSLSYRYRFERKDIRQRRSRGILERVDPGDQISLSMGFGYALSYKASLSLSYSYTYGFGNDYFWQNGLPTSSGDIVSSTLNLNTNWRMGPSRSVIVGVGIGLTNDDPDFTFSFRLPFEFDVT